MCTAAAAAVVVAILSLGYQVTEAEQTRSKMKRHQARRYEEERIAALQALAIRTEEIHISQMATADAAGVDIELNRREAAAAGARATTAAGEIGAFGASYEALLQDFGRQQAEYEGAIEQGVAIRNQFAAVSVKGAKLGYETRLLNARLPSPTRPSYAGFAIQSLGLGFQTYSAGKAI